MASPVRWPNHTKEKQLSVKHAEFLGMKICCKYSYYRVSSFWSPVTIKCTTCFNIKKFSYRVAGRSIYACYGSVLCVLGTQKFFIFTLCYKYIIFIMPSVYFARTGKPLKADIVFRYYVKFKLLLRRNALFLHTKNNLLCYWSVFIFRSILSL
jgi:hypothetical protein